jgi:hypothetical protein
MVDEDTHHIYLVVNADNQDTPIIADNQLAGIHPRPLAGDPKQNFSPTTYLLRAPNTGVSIETVALAPII